MDTVGSVSIIFAFMYINCTHLKSTILQILLHFFNSLLYAALNQVERNRPGLWIMDFNVLNYAGVDLKILIFLLIINWLSLLLSLY